MSLNHLTPFSVHLGRGGRQHDYKFIFSKFKSTFTFKLDDRNSTGWDDMNFTSCAVVDDLVITGCNTGEMKVRERVEVYVGLGHMV